jgi:hypothetical protein
VEDKKCQPESRTVSTTDYETYGRMEKGRLDLISAHHMHICKYHPELHQYVPLIHVNKVFKNSFIFNNINVNL